ncbi:VWA domain-containing protein [Balneolales bacterium ANBcel1]|nr:VWA domain-containing protein [Balneolales bacterium ANBcel1]
MIWDSPGYFWLLLLIPLLYGAGRYAAWRFRKRREKYFSDTLFSRLQPHRVERALRIKEGLFYAGLLFLIMALAGPKIGTEVREVHRDQLDLIVALDLSLSMLAEDVRPNRLEKARFEINRLLEHLSNDRIGLLLFTGHAMLHCPLTTDYSAFRMFLDIAEPDIMPSTTTDFRPMFEEAVSAFESSSRSGRDDPARVLMIFSDGEDHMDRYSEPLRQLLGMNVYIFTVGIGTEEGGRIPHHHPETGAFVDFHRDRQGQVVTTRLEPEILREMASLSGGQYFQISRTAHNIEGFIRQLGHLDRSTFATEEITLYRNRFAIPLTLSLLCFTATLLIPGYRRPEHTPP